MKSYDDIANLTKRNLEAFDFLYKDIPDLTVDDYFQLGQQNKKYAYTKNIEKFNAKISVLGAYVSFFKEFKYKINNKNVIFHVYQTDARMAFPIFRQVYHEGMYKLKITNFHSTLKNVFSKEFINKIVKKTCPVIIAYLKNNPSMKIAKTSFIPPRLKRVINLI